MIVYSFQPNEVAENLINGKEYICDPIKSDFIETDWGFKKAYQWLIERMEHHVDAKPKDVEYPAWVWIKCGENKYRPDLRETLYNLYDYNYSLLKLNISSDRILPSCFSGWHDVLNGWSHFHGNNEDYAKMSDKQIDDFINLTGEYSHLTLEDTWEDIFDVKDSEYIQGTLWKILPEDVVKVQKINRKPRI